MGDGGRVTCKSGDGVKGYVEWEMVLKGKKSGRWCGRVRRVGDCVKGYEVWEMVLKGKKSGR